MEFPLIFIVCYLAVTVFMIIVGWKIFEKAGQPGWVFIVPIYNIYILTKITGKPAIWTLYCCIPLVNVIFFIWLINMLSKSFGKDEAFTAGLIFLGVIFWPILAFSDAKYQGPHGDPAAFQAYQNKNQFDFENPQR